MPAGKIKVEQYTNPRGRESFQAKISYACRLNLSPNSLQRIKFDITQDELLVDPPDLREVSHPYEDARDPAPRVRCYSIDEILAEKTRALYERQGRDRDVYDIVHLSRDFREAISPENASAILHKKFQFKELPTPTVERIIGRVDEDTLRANWEHQLDHQLPKLPPVDGFLSELSDAITWWLEPKQAKPPLPTVSKLGDESLIPRQFLPARHGLGLGMPAQGLSSVGSMGRFDKIRYAARNRLCAEIKYHGVPRIVEPYSLRYAGTGNMLLYVHERLKNGRRSGGIKAFNVDKIESVEITDRPFTPRHLVEL
ncbi:MAG: WYL domain-containing protein [bacterium]|nr:WYL domain-containing protein [bacterium]